MSEEYTFDEYCHFNWNDSLSLKSQKNMNFTMSDISKNDLSSKIFPQENQEQWNIQEFNKKSAKKLKNKTNVKNFRQRQKIQQMKNQKKMKDLQAENKMLKAEKYCRNCKKPYGGYIQVTSIQNENQQHKNLDHKCQKFTKQKVQTFEFQKPSFYPNKQKNKNNGKIWIALGILMLVIGIHLYGFKGKDGYQDISISKIESQKWISIYEDKTNKLDDYFNVKLKMREKNSKQMQKQTQIFKQIRIFHEQQQSGQKRKDYQQITRQTIKKLGIIQERKVKQSKQMEIEESKQEQIKFHKQLLFAIQAEMDDVGNYM